MPSESAPSETDFIGPEIHKRAFDTWGFELQLLALGEELSEAAAAIFRWKNTKGTLDQVLEELVDVDALKLSVRNALGSPQVWEEVIQRKRRKLKKKLDEGVRRV